MIHVALIFHSTRNDNLGVGALTESEVSIIRSIAEKTGREIKITIVDWKAPRPAYVHGDDIDVRDIAVLRHPMEFFRLARDVDVMIDIGAGDSFADIYGRKRLVRLFMMKYLTHLARCPLVLAPQTVGPFKSGISRILASQSIRRCAIIATRDAMSTDCVRELGVKKDVLEASDVAFRLPFTSPAKDGSDGPVKVGINVSGLLMNGGYTGQNMFGLQIDYKKLIHDITQRFMDHPAGCEVHFVPHVIIWGGDGTEVEDDMRACRDLAEAFPGTKVAPSFSAPSEAKSYIAGMDFFMGARMHSCIAAFSSGVPVVPMAYSRKFEGLFGTLGYDYTVDCTTQSADAIMDRIFEAFEDREAVTVKMNAAYQKGRAKLALYEDALEKLFDQVEAR